VNTDLDALLHEAAIHQRTTLVHTDRYAVCDQCRGVWPCLVARLAEALRAVLT